MGASYSRHVGIVAVSAKEADSPLPIEDSTRILARAALREATGARIA